jgi:biotin carboxyl carrier protein
VRGQREVYEARTASLNSQLQVLRARIEQQQAAIRGAQGQMVATRNQLALIRQRRDAARAGGPGPRPPAGPARAAARHGRPGGHHAGAHRAGGPRERDHRGAERQIQQVLDQRIQEVSTELREVRASSPEAEERLRASSDVQTRRDILAPEAGTVVNLRLFTLGAVVKPGDAVLELVPGQRPAGGGGEHPALRHRRGLSRPEVEVRLPAFKQALVPFLHGEVTWVAADVTTNEQTRQQYYPAKIRSTGNSSIGCLTCS